MNAPVANTSDLEKLFGVTYISPDMAWHSGPPNDKNLYYYEVYVRQSSPISIARGDSAFMVDPLNGEATIVRGPSTVRSELVVVIRGYMSEDKSRTFGRGTYLPYVNGCSTKQLFPPERAGDPTLQYLDIPPNSAEQAHHIHSTARVVYIAEGRGMSIVGMEGKQIERELVPGMVLVLEPMCPHHFETPQGEHLVCLPIHIWSSVGVAEFAHPMFQGTFLMNQGG